jgi:septum formation protein
VTNIHLILASASPRRRELLGLLGYPFEVIVSGADEDDHLDAGPAAYVLHTARYKAETVARDLPPTQGARRLIIAADTTVALDDAILGKPASADEARAMLVALRGRAHHVHTAVCVVDSDGREESSVHTAAVTMRDYSDAEIESYIATGDPFDKAGGYAIQHPAFRPVAGLSGCYLGVVGLPLCDLVPLLRRLDVPDRFDPAALVDAHAGFRHGG